MKFALYTPLPRFAGELCDVLRLFWPVEGFAVAPTAALSAEDALKAQYTATPVTGDMEPLTHTFTEEGGVWRCAFTFRGHSAARQMAAGGDAALGGDEDDDAADGDADSATGTDHATGKAGATAAAGTDNGAANAGAKAAGTDNAIASEGATGAGAMTAAAGMDNGAANAGAKAAGTDNHATGADNASSDKGTTGAANATGTDCAAGMDDAESMTAATGANHATSGDATTTMTPAGAPDEAHAAALREKRLKKRLCKLTLYDLCVQISGHRPPWGSLTGIRPTRLLYEKLARGMGLAEAAAALTAQFDVSPEKAELLRRIVAVQLTLPAPRANDADVYISIPFCRTRCVYCSFPGEALGKGRQVQPYLAALRAEMAQAAQMLAEGGFALRALYIGGGTPTALGEADFAALLSAAGECFPSPVEYTVEAGRPDTITEGKLAAMLERGVTRVSVNPQTMNDDTLAAIGRGHTAAEAAEAFRLARRMGFENINMDVIAGLPGEGPAHFARTMAAIEALGPDSLTVHTLAIKRASRLHLTGAPLADAAAVTEMVAMGEAAALRMGMEPYYLYRQKYMAGQQQNVGYARAGAACLYNIGIMEETASVLACGAGAISKRVFADRELRIERAPNVSNVSVYVERAADMVARKRALFLRG